MCVGEKKLIFMRHGNILENGDNYESLDYDQFMKYLLKSINPKLEIKRNRNSLLNLFKLKNKNSVNAELKKYHITKCPEPVDFILCSTSLRAIQTAKLIRSNLPNKPEINQKRKIKVLLNEVKFSEDILQRDEFEKLGGYRRCRPILLERWFRGKNKETFQDSLLRLQKLDKYIESLPYEHILLVSHGIYSRLFYLYYSKKLTLKNEKEVCMCDKNLKQLLKAPRLEFGDTFEFNIKYSTKMKIETHS